MDAPNHSESQHSALLLLSSDGCLSQNPLEVLNSNRSDAQNHILWCIICPVRTGILLQYTTNTCDQTPLHLPMIARYQFHCPTWIADWLTLHGEGSWGTCAQHRIQCEDRGSPLPEQMQWVHTHRHIARTCSCSLRGCRKLFSHMFRLHAGTVGWQSCPVLPSQPAAHTIIR